MHDFIHNILPESTETELALLKGSRSLPNLSPGSSENLSVAHALSDPDLDAAREEVIKHVYEEKDRTKANLLQYLAFFE